MQMKFNNNGEKNPSRKLTGTGVCATVFPRKQLLCAFAVFYFSFSSTRTLKSWKPFAEHRRFSADLQHRAAAGIRYPPYVTLCCLPTRAPSLLSLSLSLCASPLCLQPSPLKRHTGGCAPLDTWARILTLETEDGHVCMLWWLNYCCGNRGGLGDQRREGVRLGGRRSSVC